MSKPLFSNFDTLTFDVVGTLIDFEAGILNWVKPAIQKHNVQKSDEEILTTFAKFEDKHQQESPEKPFTAMLPLIYQDMANEWGFSPEASEGEEFQQSIQNWPAFPDTVESLRELKKQFKLVAVTNADSWALKYMSATLDDLFDEQVTCDEVGLNKPSHKVFEYALNKLSADKSKVLHTAQSQYHDIVPATELGFSTMWIERRHGQPSFGATPKPQSLAEPTYHATGMADFVRQVKEQQNQA